MNIIITVIRDFSSLYEWHLLGAFISSFLISFLWYKILQEPITYR